MEKRIKWASRVSNWCIAMPFITILLLFVFSVVWNTIGIPDYSNEPGYSGCGGYALWLVALWVVILSFSLAISGIVGAISSIYAIRYTGRHKIRFVINVIFAFFGIYMVVGLF